jgi:hypothetical protein
VWALAGGPTPASPGLTGAAGAVAWGQRGGRGVFSGELGGLERGLSLSKGAAQGRPPGTRKFAAGVKQCWVETSLSLC